MKSPTVLLKSLLQDCKRLSGVKGTERDFVSLCKRFEHEGYGFLTVALPALCDSLDRGLAEGRFTCPLGFSRLKGAAIPKLFSGMLCEVFDAYSGLLKQDPRLDHVKNLRQILRMFKKIVPNSVQSSEIERKTKDEFHQVDGEVLDVSHASETYRHHLDRVMDLCLPGLKSWDSTDFHPRHGPGSVFEGMTSNQKWIEVVDSITQGAIDCDFFSLTEFSFTVNPELHLVPCSLENSITVEGDRRPRRIASRDTAKLVTVPKTFSTLRTITIEPCLKQFVQQGLGKRLRQEIERCRILSNSLALTDQSKNQELAMEGSRTGAWSTLDLKSASDLLSNSLVRLLFDRYGIYYHALISCRTNEVKDATRLLTLNKYAGMGNATTFPVQSVAFAVIAIASILFAQGKKPTLKNCVAVSRQVRVYGDDIIVKTDVVHHVIAWLREFGLRVNTTKSFTTGNFRESCGVDAFMGVNVTPIYLRVRPDDSSLEANSVASLVSFSNQCWLQGLYGTATCIANEVEDRLGRRLPLTRVACEGLGWHTRLDAYEYRKVSRTLHRPEIKTYVIVPRKRNDKLDGYPALLKAFLTPLIERSKDHLKKTPERFKNRIAWRRVAA